MKGLLAMCVTCLVCSGSAAPSSQTEMYVARAVACQGKVGGTEADIASVWDLSKLPESTGAKKILACILKEDKVIVDGKFSPEGSLEFMRNTLAEKPDSEKKLEIVKEVIEKCGNESTKKSPGSEEELAVILHVCFLKNFKENGLEMN